MTGPRVSDPGTRSICLRCGYIVHHLIREIEDDWLERCPDCGAYDWTPEPIWQSAEPKDAA